MATTQNELHVLRILGPEGDIKHEWHDPASKEAEKAGVAFGEKIGNYQAVADGKPTRVFDPEASETTMFPQMQAGC